MLPGDPCVASPSGASATKPRASIGQNETPARMAASIVACSCAWLSTPFSRKAAGEVNQRLFLIELSKHFGSSLKRGQLTVGVEDVEFAVVLAERSAGIGGAGIVWGFFPSLVFSHDHRFEDAQQTVAVIGEILQHFNGTARISHDGNEIRRSHLRLDKLLSGTQRTCLVGGRHGCHVKIQCQQTTILVSDVSWRFGRDLGSRKFMKDRDIVASGTRRTYH